MPAPCRLQPAQVARQQRRPAAALLAESGRPHAEVHDLRLLRIRGGHDLLPLHLEIDELGELIDVFRDPDPALAGCR